MNDQPRTVLVGAGNLGSHLGKALLAAGVPVIQAFSRFREKAAAVGAPYVTSLEKIDPTAGLYLLAVADDAIGPVAGQLAGRIRPDAIVAHTSGATPSTVLRPLFAHYGVFYPVQTFSRERAVDFRQLPICLHASGAEDLEVLTSVARALTDQVHTLDDEQRAVLHVAAVWVNNFANHLFAVADDILTREGLPFDLLRPLLLETASKAVQHAPAAVQTGPAARGDRRTIERHLAFLEKYPEYSALYRQLTEAIRQAEHLK